MNRPTNVEVLTKLRSICKVRCGAKNFAVKHGFSPTFISGVLSGNDKPTDRLIEALGWHKTVVWEKIKQ